MATKFHEKNQAVFMGLQSAEDSPVATSSLGATTAIACTTVTGDPTRETGSYTYLGDNLSRDEYTYEKDEYIDLQLDTFQQILGAGATSPIDPDTASIFKLFQVCGAEVYVASALQAIVTNSADAALFGTVDFRKSSPDHASDKLYKFYDLRGSVDVSASVGEVPSLKFSLKGNAQEPELATKQVANFGTQTTKVAKSVLPATVQSTQILELNPNETFTTTVTTTATVTQVGSQVTVTLPVGSTFGAELFRVQLTNTAIAAIDGIGFSAKKISDTKAIFFVKGLTGTNITSATVTVKTSATVSPQSFCFATLNAPNFFGFDYQRYTTGCNQGFSKGAVPTDVSVSMLEDHVDSVAFLPDVNTTKFFSVAITIGTGVAGENVTYMWDKLQLATVKQGKIASYLARDCTFRNTGSSHIVYT